MSEWASALYVPIPCFIPAVVLFVFSILSIREGSVLIGWLVA